MEYSPEFEKVWSLVGITSTPSTTLIIESYKEVAYRVWQFQNNLNQDEIGYLERQISQLESDLSMIR